LPFYTLAHELYPGKYRPTITHCFTKLLYDKGLLLKLFTQNIDCLEREAGVPGEMIVEAHGSFATQRCIECKTQFPDTMMREAVHTKEVPRCLEKTCNGLVKPDIVFFGEALPEAFHRNRTLPASADLAIVMGTSLTVQPFASLPSFVREEIPRILINLERVGGLGSRADDVLLLGDCDSGVRKLADALGWLDDLETLWQQTNPSEKDQEDQQLPPRTRDEKWEEEVNQLTRDIDKTLKLSENHKTWLQDHLKDKHELRQNGPALLENTVSLTSMTSKHSELDKPQLETTTSNNSHKQNSTEANAAEIAAEKAALNSSDKQIDEEPKATTNRADDLVKDQMAKEDGNSLDHIFPHRDKTS
jgi:NAD+-dependent protein deacetylase SIR2